MDMDNEDVIRFERSKRRRDVQNLLDFEAEDSQAGEDEEEDLDRDLSDSFLVQDHEGLSSHGPASSRGGLPPPECDILCPVCVIHQHLSSTLNLEIPQVEVSS